MSEDERLAGESALCAAPRGGSRPCSRRQQPSDSGVARRVEFYKANGFEEVRRGVADLLSGHSMPCVFMRKLLRDHQSRLTP